MMLSDYCDNHSTDKNTAHSYIELYQNLLSTKKDTATHILEVGIGPRQPNGGSIKMWANYFTNANIYALDIIPISEVNPELINHSRIYLHTSSDAYNADFFTNTFLSKQMKFDILLDDGPHTLNSMVSFITLYHQVMKEDGILMIEDVQDISWCNTLYEVTPDHLRPFITIYDRRAAKGRWDDIVFVINKNKPE